MIITEKEMGVLKIYTKTGDKGQTSLYDGTRVDKCSLRVEAYGTIDELSSFIALAATMTDDDTSNILRKIEKRLFYVSGQLATSKGNNYNYNVRAKDIEELEKVIDYYVGKTEKVNAFIVPGTNKTSATVNIARTVCRRAERQIVSLQKSEEVDELLIKYINRLSDALYAIGRYLEKDIIMFDFDASYDEPLFN